MWTKIEDNLLLGDLQDAKEFATLKDGVIICVLENRPEDEPFRALHIPIITNSSHVHSKDLSNISDVITALLNAGNKVFVHCMAGLERSPLVIAYHLAKTKRITLDEGYRIVKKNRPQIYDRSTWLID